MKRFWLIIGLLTLLSLAACSAAGLVAENPEYAIIMKSKDNQYNEEVAESFRQVTEEEMCIRDRSMFRKIIFLGGAFLIPATMGIKYIFYTEPISDFVSAAVSVTIYFLVIDKIINRRPVFRKQKA